MENIEAFYNKRQNIYRNRFVRGSLYEKAYNFVRCDSNVLDVGCANGDFSRELKKKKCTVYAIEVSSEMAKNARKYLDHVVVGNIESMKLRWKKRFFHSVLFMDVLEHLFDPKTALARVRPFLTDSGTVIVSLPNVANWEIRFDLLIGRFNSSKSAILEEGHIRFFTYDTARKMFEDAGYSVERFDLVINLPLFLLKIQNRFPFLSLSEILKNNFPKLFGYQFIFELKKGGKQ